MQKEGESGYATINQYTRYLTVILAAAQSTGYAFLFRRQGVLDANLGRMTLIIITLTVGCTLLMWMGELDRWARIAATGSRLHLRLHPGRPADRDRRLVERRTDGEALLPADRARDHRGDRLHPGGPAPIPIQYAKRMVGRRMTAGGSTYMPLRVNMAGVIPVIFAAA